ncbi:MAG TPA: hypothetical protein VF281_03075 [Candidatus Saccharimonadales bacterium]
MNSHRTIASFRIDSVKDQPLPSHFEGLPFSSEQINELLENCPAILVSPEAIQDSLPFSSDESADPYNYQLRQPSSEHRRSFEIVPTEPGQTWTDEYGNEYSALTLKGNNFSNPSILEHPTASEGFIAYGLQESSIIGRVMRASQLLRSRHITTEHTIGLAEPKQYPWPLIDSMTNAHELIPLKEYKRRIVTQYWEDLPDSMRTPAELAELYRKFEDMTFYVSLRATDTAYRLHDMQNEQTRRNVYNQIDQQHLLPEGADSLDPTNPNDIDRYLEHVFCPRAGRNYARLHTDMTHGFAHGLNMSALGSIVDLDSISGAPLGFDDKEITDKDRAKDIADVMSAISTMQYFRAPTGCVHFMHSYINETIAQHSSLDSALDQLTSVLDILHKDVQSRDRLNERDYTNIAIAYAYDYFYQLVETALPEGQIDKLQTEIRSYLRDAISNPEITAAIHEEFNANSQTYVDELIDEHTNEISTAVYEGGRFDILEAIQQTYSRPSSHVGSLMIEQTLLTYYNEITRHIIAARTQQKSQETDENIPSDVAHRVAQLHILRQYNDELRPIAEAKVAELIPLLEDRLIAATNFTVSKSLLPDYPSFANMGLSESHLWLCTDQVPLTAAVSCIESSNLHLEIDQLLLSDDVDNTVIIPAFTPGVVIDEIISDSLFDGWTHVDNEDESVLLVSLDKQPSYMLTRETNSQGEQYLTLQLPKDAYEALAAGKISLRQLLPADVQPTLF